MRNTTTTTTTTTNQYTTHVGNRREVKGSGPRSRHADEGSICTSSNENVRVILLLRLPFAGANVEYIVSNEARHAVVVVIAIVVVVQQPCRVFPMLLESSEIEVIFAIILYDLIKVSFDGYLRYRYFGLRFGRPIS